MRFLKPLDGGSFLDRDFGIDSDGRDARMGRMKIPAFWIRERREIGGAAVRLRGVSQVSMEEARARLEERARLWAEWRSFSGGRSEEQVGEFRKKLRQLDDLGGEYSSCILEPVEQRIDGDNIITRNRYGSLVLNSASVCFADVDAFPPRGIGSFFSMLLGKGAEARLLAAVDRLVRDGEKGGARVYRTAHGWRVVLRGAPLASARQRRIFKALNVDPLYAKLCDKQGCWRARLSPKPFHLGLHRFPRLDDSASCASLVADWVKDYESKTSGLGVCRLIGESGGFISDPVVELHDRMTRAREEGLELA